jgi:hypothetical protein
MAGITFQIPIIDAEHSLEIEVRVNGGKKKYHYRIEIFKWQDCQQPQNHAECLKAMIKEYDRQWQLIQIGGPTNENIPVIFKQLSN